MNLKYKKFIYTLVGGIIILSCSYNFYQHNKINAYKEELTNIVRNNVQEFASTLANTNDEVLYARKYASIVTAQQAYIVLSDKNGFTSDEWSSSLPGLFLEIKQVMINDKYKFKEVFKESEVSELMFKISDNFEDGESINKVYKLLSD
ncbi:hypothetical protein [Clostridium algidicarnis]|uniref:hypothetical protein n=1 Tax=Clostridium algidicarnis TaxID=37659 RepID=UPI001C0CCEE1|nr:hypothetical protein [Clostridium algidicarnis]MBU3204336.1 hypothetical protein [Clostridium algidicarnis]MBU3212580.1 hypothetical protein [Clostridium algidicarnis]MBU3223011.1 hypothetical protein [Clostridium algidicarnis]